QAMVHRCGSAGGIAGEASLYALMHFRAQMLHDLTPVECCCNPERDIMFLPQRNMPLYLRFTSKLRPNYLGRRHPTKLSTSVRVGCEPINRERKALLINLGRSSSFPSGRCPGQ